MAFGRFDNNGYDFLGRLFVQYKKIYFEKNDSKSVEILKYFIDNKIGSTYQCHKYMNNEKKIKISYKNVLKKIKKLSEKGFIIKNYIYNNTHNTEKGKHGAIYYTLSNFGIFYLFSSKNIIINPLELHISIILNHEELVLYKNILFPYIPLRILKELKSAFIWNSILRYIQYCCFTIENAFIHISKQDHIIKPIEKIGGLLYWGPFTIHLFLEELRIGKSFATFKPLELNELDKKVERYHLLEEFLIDKDGKEIVKISNKENERILYFKISENKMTENKEKKLQIYENDYRNNNLLVFEVDISDTRENIKTLKESYLPLTWKELMKFYFEDGGYLLQMTNNLMELFLNMLSIKYEIIIPSNESKKTEEKNVFDDITLLKKNTNFMNSFYTIKEYIETNFRNFDKLSIT